MYASSGRKGDSVLRPAKRVARREPPPPSGPGGSLAARGKFPFRRPGDPACPATHDAPAPARASGCPPARPGPRRAHPRGAALPRGSPSRPGKDAEGGGGSAGSLARSLGHSFSRPVEMLLPAWLLSLALSVLPAGSFIMHLETDCILSAEGKVLHSYWTLFFNKIPFTCFDTDQQLFLPCGLGAVVPWNYTGVPVAQWLNEVALGMGKHTAKACRKQLNSLWGKTGDRQTVPNVRIFPITPRNTPDPLMLACVAWGFYPGSINITWLWDGAPVKLPQEPMVVSSNGDWSYQARLTLPVDPQRGGTYTCLVAHASLSQPIAKDWRPGISSELWIKIGVSTGVLVIGVGFLVAGLICWRRQRSQGYIALEGNDYPAGQ